MDAGSCSFCNRPALQRTQASEGSWPYYQWPWDPQMQLARGFVSGLWCASSFWGRWYPCLRACFPVLLFGFDFLKYFLYFNSDPRDLESTPLLFPNKNQTGNKHIAFETVKLGAPSEDTALGLGSLPARVRADFPGGNSAAASQAGGLKENLAFANSFMTGPMRH